MYMTSNPMAVFAPPGSVNFAALDAATQALINGKVAKAGDTMTGNLQMAGSNGSQSSRIDFLAPNGYGVHMMVDGALFGSGGFGIANKANTAYNLTMDDNGNLVLHGSITVQNVDAGSALVRFNNTAVTNYAMFFEMDASNFYLLQSASPNGSFNTLRPFFITLATGQVNLDGSGTGGTVCGGNLQVNSNTNLKGTLAVTGTSTLTGNVTAQNGITMSGGTAGLTGPLNVSGNINAYSTLMCTGGMMMASSNNVNIGASQGAYCAWNESSGSGMTSFVNNEGGGGGGFIWRNINQNNTAETMRMTLDGAGNLTVPNTIQTPQWISATGGQSKTVTNFGYLNQGGAGQSPGQNTTSVSIYANQAMMANQFWAFSDRRIKREIEPINTKYALEFVRRVEPVQFYKDEQTVLTRGFIAQDVGKMSPGGREMLNATDRPGLKGEIDADGYESPANFVLSIDYDQIIPVHATVLRNLLDRVDRLEAELRKRT